MVTTALVAVYSFQSRTLEIRNSSWKNVEENFEFLEQAIQILGECDQLLFRKEQIHFNHDTISSLPVITIAMVKSYRSALYTKKKETY